MPGCPIVGCCYSSLDFYPTPVGAGASLSRQVSCWRHYSSLRQGLEPRHLLAFLPFCWMMAAPLFREFPRLVHRLPLMLMTFLIVLHQRQICHRYSLHPSLGDRVIGNSQFLEKFLSQNPHKEITVAADNSNLYFDLKFSFRTRQSSTWKPRRLPQRERIGVIFVAKEKAPTHWSDLQRRPAYLLGKYNLSGGTSYDLLYEK